LKYNIETDKSVQGKGELVDAINRGEVKLGEVKKEELPEELRKLSKDELKSYLDKKQTERSALQTDLPSATNGRISYKQLSALYLRDSISR
jgi:hypothetical protein